MESNSELANEKEIAVIFLPPMVIKHLESSGHFELEQSNISHLSTLYFVLESLY